MTKAASPAQLVFDEASKRYFCKGTWAIISLNNLLEQFKHTAMPSSQTLVISGKTIKKLDSAGALTLLQCIDQLKAQKNQVELIDFTPQQRNLIELIDSKKDQLTFSPPAQAQQGALFFIGQEALHKLDQTNGLLTLVGMLTKKMSSAFAELRRFHVASIVTNIYSSGIQALPIVGLLSFLIGVVLAYQLGLELETYGANNFIAYLSGMAIFREFGPLITAIIIAGRTSSAYTAQIGSMKIHEEIDALNTMGLSPVELLVIPKVVSLIIIFPLLIFWSDFFSIVGSMVMAKFMLSISYSDFLARLQESVGLKQLMLGLYKSPAFALLIALVGCFQGFQVGFSADSVGTQTTKSVVQALFLIIIADAIYSVIYGWLDL